jgi:hypothetical protein
MGGFFSQVIGNKCLKTSNSEAVEGLVFRKRVTDQN